ncbi:Ger(x)C family spore germination protein [Paenibacillus phocaensis]|uniref:Ger(x)C family spore germination protein n=1 Tax=Paenibacillus phocaensis TaxID=1776378 RepID=UPI0003A0DE90|nr:Ger(x)C family spore germination protein [Paenibacillus phocaensis]
MPNPSRVKRLAVVACSSLILLSLTGCWNYREVDKVITVAGIAIDKGKEEGEIRLTIEMVDGSGGEDLMHIGSKRVTLSGSTMFEIVRNMITETGMRLYWAHAKSIILSEEIAREGASKVLDWYVRDTETRADIRVLVSGEKTAEEVLRTGGDSGGPLSFKIDEILKNEHSVSNFPVMEIFDFADTINTTGLSSILPMIYVKGSDGKQVASIGGLAVFDKDKMLGTMDANQTKYVLFLRDEIKGGILPLGGYRRSPSISLEIFKSKTKVEPVLVNGQVEIRVKTHTVVSVDEAQENINFSSKWLADTEKIAEDLLVKEMESVIGIAQQRYQQDIFGFGNRIHKKMPKVWKSLEKDWDEHFSKLKVTVEADVEIKNTASVKKLIQPEEED